MPKVVSVKMEYPTHRYQQGELLERFLETSDASPTEQNLTRRFFKSVKVQSRHLSRPVEDMQSRPSFEQKNKWWQESALSLSVRAVQGVLQEQDLSPHHVDLIATTTVTGISVPTLESKLMNHFDFRSDVKRMPFFGLGCVAGVAGLNRVADYLRGHPKTCALFVAVELCTLTFQAGDMSPANIIATSLFGDGCGVVLMVGDEHPLAMAPGLMHLRGRSHFFKDSEAVMGWEMDDLGFHVVLNNEVPQYVEEGLPVVTRELRVPMEKIQFVLAHPGGPKVLQSIQKVWPFPESFYQSAWDNLAKYGNLSSVSVLSSFSDFLKSPLRGSGLSVAFGPGFCAELGLWEFQP